MHKRRLCNDTNGLITNIILALTLNLLLIYGLVKNQPVGPRIQLYRLVLVKDRLNARLQLAALILSFVLRIIFICEYLTYNQTVQVRITCQLARGRDLFQRCDVWYSWLDCQNFWVKKLIRVLIEWLFMRHVDVSGVYDLFNTYLRWIAIVIRARIVPDAGTCNHTRCTDVLKKKVFFLVYDVLWFIFKIILRKYRTFIALKKSKDIRPIRLLILMFSSCLNKYKSLMWSASAQLFNLAK